MSTKVTFSIKKREVLSMCKSNTDIELINKKRRFKEGKKAASIIAYSENQINLISFSFFLL